MSGNKTAVYQRRQPERTVLYNVIQQFYLSWQEHIHADSDDRHELPFYIQREFERYSECGILAHGFARVHCDNCQHDFLVAFSCKNRGVCPSCTTRHMANTAAHLVDNVFPRLPPFVNG